VKNKLLNLGKLIFTILLLWILFSYIDYTEIKEIISEAKPWYFLIMIAIWYIGVYISTLRWKVILNFYNIKLSTSYLYNLYWIGSFMNNFLPSSFGGDSYKFIELNKKFPKSKGQVLSSILLERIVGLLTGLPLSILAGLILMQNISFSKELLGLLAFTSFIFIFFIIALVSPFKLPDLKIPLIDKLIKGINILLSFNSKSDLIKTFIYSTIFLFISFISLFFLFFAFNTNISFLTIIFVYPLIQLTGAIPFSINSLGIQEGSAVYLFSLFGISPEITLSVMITSRILSLLVTGTGGIRYLLS
jgi:uncharacterized protein (TIRG00374 family)